MAEQKSRPVPKRRSKHLQNGSYSTADLYGSQSKQDEEQSTLITSAEPSRSGLPSCVHIKSSVVSADQKDKDSKLPLFLHKLDEACKNCSNDADKSSLAILCMQSASSPIRKYRILQFFDLLQNNKNNIKKLSEALAILEKYAVNLLRDKRPVQWRVIKLNTGIIQTIVFPVQGAVDVLKQMGYTEEKESYLTFPSNVDQPNNSIVLVLAADLSIARHEVDALTHNRHPFLIFDPSAPHNIPAEGSLQVKGFTQVEDSSSSGFVNGYCGVCSEQNLARACTACDMQFCAECDERWHAHKLRRSHKRTSLASKKIPDVDKKVITQRPVPVPRKRSQTPEGSNSGNDQDFVPTPHVSSATRTTFEHFSHDLPGNQQIKHPPSQGDNVMSPSNVMLPGNMMTSPSNMATHGNMPSPGNVTLPGSMNVNVNPSYQRQVFNPMFDAYTQQLQQQQQQQRTEFGHYSPQDGDRPGKSMKQSYPKTLHRVLSCPNCSHLYVGNETKCPRCDTNLDPAQQTGFNLDMAASRLPEVAQEEVLLKDLAMAEKKTQRMPDEPRGPGVATRVEHEATYEEIDEMLEWECEHCTTLNPLTTKICQTCCKTPSDLKKFPNLVEKSKTPEVRCSREVPSARVGSPGAAQDHRTVYMTPKDRPLEGGIFVNEAVQLSSKKLLNKDHPPRGIVLGAQKNREQELSEKEKGRIFSMEKEEFLKKGIITETEYYNIPSPEVLRQIVENRKRMGYPGNDPSYSAGDPSYPKSALRAEDTENPGHGLNDEQLLQLLESGVITKQDLINNGVRQNIQGPPQKPGVHDLALEKDVGDMDYGQQAQRDALYDVPKTKQKEVENDLALSEEQLQQLLREGGFLEDKPVQPLHFTTDPDSRLTYEERLALREAGIDVSIQHPQSAYALDPPVNPAVIEAMFEEYKTLDTLNDLRNNYDKNIHQSFVSVRQGAPVIQDLYDKRSSPVYVSMPVQKSNSSFFDVLNSKMPVENFSRNFIDDQSRVYVKWIKEAEKFGFTPEEVNLASNFTWQDPKGRNPVQWLKDEWTSRVAEVIGKVTEQTSNEDDRIGNLSTDEAKQALLENHGSVESACKACIESRREKLAKMGETSVFGRADCLNALDRNDGNVEQALLELEKKAMEPLIRRVLGAQKFQCVGSRSRLDDVWQRVVENKHVSFERRVRVMYAEKRMRSWGRAETAVKLIDMGFNVDDCIEAAKAYGDMNRSLAYLQQECPICVEMKPEGQMITFLGCQDKICKNCVRDYLTVRIKEMQIHTIVCPVCDLPDLTDEVEAVMYFNNLDIMMRGLVDPEVHDLFQKKLRDRALSKEKNFRWCAHCSCGFINELPAVNKMQCPNCQHFTCFSCKKPWEDQHEGISCEQFAQWKLENDVEFQMAGLAGHLARNGIDCPACKFRYDLARGGCMHFKCNQCGHEFCSGCGNPFKHGERCNVLPSCATRGLHAHHPRDCLYHLRDWEPARLQQLLHDSGVNYQADAQGLSVQDGENEGAVAGQKCKVMEQKDLGTVDVACGRDCEPGHDGLCRIHYIEYLVDLINKNGIDPADKMTLDEISIVDTRAGIQVLPREPGEDEQEYKQRLLTALKQQVPLPRHPGLQPVGAEEPGEAE